jgi:DNA-binding response OmpR family regulator
MRVEGKEGSSGRLQVRWGIFREERERDSMARILIIEDDLGVRSMLRRVLEGAEHEVIEAGDGRMGLNLFRQEAVDLVITDIVMPEKEGLETILELRQSNPAVKIIAISGGDSKGYDYLASAERFGALRTFRKPFVIWDLLDAVQEMLRE